MRSVMAILTLVSCVFVSFHDAYGQMKDVLPEDPELRKAVAVAVTAIPKTDRVLVTLSGSARPGYRVDATMTIEETAETGVRQALSAPLKVERSENSAGWSAGFVASPQLLANALVEISIVDESPNVPRGRFWLYRLRLAKWLDTTGAATRPITGSGK